MDLDDVYVYVYAIIMVDWYVIWNQKRLSNIWG